ncbi:MAG: hypothetical protein GBAus27B_000231 [Mycoplasmataceae bacterium]|nr:MAG: hypothetical protein GBAus27B_000231 [Mycoplasmataceae bacterium]
MTNKENLLDELKNKQGEGNLKPSDFKRNRGWSSPNLNANNNSENSTNPQLAQVQAELRTLQEKFQQAQQIITKLKDQRNALELALFDKRLENLKEFSDYREKIKFLEETELSEIANLRKQNELLKKKLEKNQFSHQLSLDTSAKLVILVLALALFLNLLTK